MTNRVTTAQLAEKMDGVADSIDKLVSVLTANAAAPAPVANTPSASESPSEIEVDGAYADLMSTKAQGHADNKGEDVVLYARRNKQGQTKLAYALETRFSETLVKAKSCLGAIKTFKPSA